MKPSFLSQLESHQINVAVQGIPPLNDRVDDISGKTLAVKSIQKRRRKPIASGMTAQRGIKVFQKVPVRL